MEETAIDAAREPVEEPVEETPRRPRPVEETVEDLMRRTGTDLAIHAGTCAARGWASGKRVTERTYRAATQRWARSPIDAAG